MPVRPPTLPRRTAPGSYDQRRYAALPTRRLYATARWRALRADQLRRFPLCALCQPIATAATVCDHLQPHRGDVARFWSGPFQSLCAACHSSLKQRQEMGTVGG